MSSACFNNSGVNPKPTPNVEPIRQIGTTKYWLDLTSLGGHNLNLIYDDCKSTLAQGTPAESEGFR